MLIYAQYDFKVSKLNGVDILNNQVAGVKGIYFTIWRKQPKLGLQIDPVVCCTVSDLTAVTGSRTSYSRLPFLSKRISGQTFKVI